MKIQAIQLKSFFLVAILFCFLAGCENTIDFYEERESYYSMYGVLSISDSESFIRVHDTRIPIERVTEDNLNVAVTLSNKSTGVAELLERRILIFEGATTHNFVTGSGLDFSTEYQVFLEDESGYQDSVNVFTPAFTEPLISPIPFTYCSDLVVQIDISPVSEGEFIDFFVEFEWNGRLFRARRATDVFETGGGVSLRFNIQRILEAGFGTDEFSCFDVPVTDYRFQYTHFGREIEGREPLINEGGNLEVPYFGTNILGAYTDGLEFSVSDTAFNFDYWFPPQKN